MSLCLRFSFRDPYIDGAFCRFVGHVRNVNYQNATRNDRQIELVGTCWCPVCERKNTARARERRRRGGGGEMNRRAKITKVVKK